MAITALNTIKNWFKTGLIPTQAQFWDTWDSFRHKSENIPVAEIEGIDALLLNKAEKEALESHINDENAHAPLFLDKEDKIKKGVAGGYAPLDDFAKLASQYLNIIDNLYDGGSKSILSAQQGLVLQNQIDAINTLLGSDNINLDTVQEIVDAIELLQNTAGTVLVNDLISGGVTKALTAEMGKVLNEVKLTAKLATDVETQITAAVTEDNKVVSRSKLYNWWFWQKSIAQYFTHIVCGIFQKKGFSPMYIRVNNETSDVLEDLRINVASGNSNPFFERCIVAAATKGSGTWERCVTTVNDATNAVKGVVKLAGDLGGTADLPTVPELATKLTGTLATDAETQINVAVPEDNKVVSRLKLFNWWVWQKTRAQVFSSSVQANGFNTGSYVSLSLDSADFNASATKRISIDAVNSRIVAQNGATTTIIYFDPTPKTNNIYVPNATGRILLDSTLKDVYLNNFQKTTFSPIYIRVNNSGSDVVEDLRINVASGNNRPFFERCIVAGLSKGNGTWERTVSTVKINNTAAAQGAIAINSTIDMQLNNSVLFTWELDALSSRTGAATSELINANKVLDVDNKTTNFFRVTLEVSYAAGAGDGTIDLALINPSNVIIDQESESINVDGAGATSKIIVFRLFAVKTSDNNVGYTLRMTTGSKALTAWRIKSILRTNN